MTWMDSLMNDIGGVAVVLCFSMNAVPMPMVTIFSFPAGPFIHSLPTIGMNCIFHFLSGVVVLERRANVFPFPLVFPFPHFPQPRICQEVWVSRGRAYVRNFGLFLVLMGPKNAFFGAMDCSLREASHKEQSIAPPKSGNDGRIEESSRRLHWSDITGTLDLITLYNMFTRADIQCTKQALQI